jgi:hypothetical protein
LPQDGGIVSMPAVRDFRRHGGSHEPTAIISTARQPWNKDKLVGQKRPFKLNEIWTIRVRLQLSGRSRELALFNLGIDSKLRACDLVKLRVRDVLNGDRAVARARVVQQKPGSGQFDSS